MLIYTSEIPLDTAIVNSSDAVELPLLDTDTGRVVTYDIRRLNSEPSLKAKLFGVMFIDSDKTERYFSPWFFKPSDTPAFWARSTSLFVYELMKCIKFTGISSVIKTVSMSRWLNFKAEIKSGVAYCTSFKPSDPKSYNIHNIFYSKHYNHNQNDDSYLSIEFIPNIIFSYLLSEGVDVPICIPFIDEKRRISVCRFANFVVEDKERARRVLSKFMLCASPMERNLLMRQGVAHQK